MKYAVEYTKPHFKREPRRTRFVSLNMAKKKKEAHEEMGFQTRLVPKSEFKDNSVKKRGHFINNYHLKGTSNYWKFFIDARGSLRCIKNGKVIALSKLP